jgi:threonine/homoserine/homoserine lactone efflux protein
MLYFGARGIAAVLLIASGIMLAYGNVFAFLMGTGFAGLVWLAWKYGEERER